MTEIFEGTKNTEKQVKNIDSADKKEFLQNFIAGKEEIQSTEEAKTKDKITLLEAKIKDIQATKKSQNDTIKACKAVIDSNAYPKLSPIISSFSAHLEKLDKKKDKKIAKNEKRLKKAKRKLKKLQSKQKRSELLKAFLSSTIHSSSDKQTAYIDAMRALKEDSLGRANKQLDKTESRLIKLNEKLNSGSMSEVDKLKINSQIKKVESKRDKLIARINNLNELEQELNKLAKIELVDDKIDKLRNTAVETAEKAAMEGSSVSETIDNIAENSNSVIEQVLEPEKVEEKDKENQTAEQEKQAKKQAETKQKESEQQTQNSEKEEIQTESAKDKNKNLMKKVGLTQKQVMAIVGAGIALDGLKMTDEKCTIIYSKDKKEKINDVLNSLQAQTKNKPMTR